MYKARIRKTQKIVEAEDLKVIPEVNELDFACVDKDCDIDLIPCSYGKFNKVRPYFKKNKGVEHSSNCEYSKLLKYLNIGKNRQITDDEFSRFDYPSKLIEKQKKILSTDTSTSDDLSPNTGRAMKTIMSGEFDSVMPSNKHVTSINLIIDFFISCPYNRDVYLKLLSKEGTYRHLFKSIFGESKGQYESGKIFHGVLYPNSKKSIRHEDQFVFFQLLSCERWEVDFSGKNQVNPYWVKLNKNHLSKTKLNRILEDRQTVNNQSNLDYKEKKKNKETNAYVFFLGNAPTYKEPYIFEVVDDYISFRYTQVNHPDDE
ncbi:MAG: hypothetical protein COA32_10165 [Fluviicola sp.]|nr:MAG: hypothetical protein COA32_10165 [Fluviicola sp.]